MNRRGFLRMIGEAAAAGLILPDIARDLIVPARTIFLPLPKTIDIYSGDLALDLDEFSRRIIQPAIEALARKIEEDLLANALVYVADMEFSPLDFSIAA